MRSREQVKASRRAAMLIFASLASATAMGQQADRARTEALANRAHQRLQALRAEADRLATQERTILTQLRQLDVERQIKAEELAGVERDASQVAADIAATDARISSLEADGEAARPTLEARLVEMYKVGRGRYLRLLLSATDLRQVGQNARLVAALAKIDSDRLASYKTTIAELTTARDELHARQAELETLRTQTVAAQAELARSVASRTALVRRIDQERDVNARFAGELQAAQVKLRATLDGLAAGRATTPSTLPLAPFQGDLPWPVEGTFRRHVGRSAGQGAASGVEILADEGSPVRAVHDGRVVFAGNFSGFGNLVILDHGSRNFTLYGDLLDLAVTTGTQVDRGDPLGEVGTLPAGPPGLYFELRIDGEATDPLQWLTRRQGR